MDIVENISQTVSSSLEDIYSNKTTSAVIGLFLVLYAGLAAPKLPKSVAKMFGNPVFRLVILFLVAYMSSRNTSIAIIATVALVISMQTLSYHEANEKIQQKIEEEVEMETINEMVDEEDDNNEEVQEEISSYNANGEYAEYSEENEELVSGESFRPEEEHHFGEGEEEEIVGNNQEELYAPVNEEEVEGHLHEFRPEEEMFEGEETYEEEIFRPEEEQEVVSEEVPRQFVEEVESKPEEVVLRAQPENPTYKFNVSGFSGHEFATY